VKSGVAWVLGNVRQCVFLGLFAITNLSGRLPLIHTNLANRLLLANTRDTEKDRSQTQSDYLP